MVSIDFIKLDELEKEYGELEKKCKKVQIEI